MNLDYIIFSSSAITILLIIQSFVKQNGNKKYMGTLPLLMYVLIFALLVTGWFLVENETTKVKQDIITQLSQLAPTLAYELQHNGHDKLSLNTKEDDHHYIAMINKMVDWMNINPAIDSLYTFRKLTNGDIVFVLGPETDYNRNGIIDHELEERVPLGERYDEDIPELHDAFEGTATYQTQTEAYTDKWGTTISAFSPIFNEQGEVDGVLGIDLLEETWNDQIGLVRFKAFGLLSAIYFLFVSTYWGMFHFRRAESRVRMKEQQLVESEERYKSLVEYSPEAIIVIQNNIIKYVNPAAITLLGATKKDDLIEQDVFQFLSRRDHTKLKQMLDFIQVEGKEMKSVEESFIIEGVQQIIVEVTGSPIIYLGRLSAQFIIRDITEKIEHEKALHYQAYFDHLTGLPNGLLRNERLSEAIAQARAIEDTVSVIMLDLDGFKYINGSVGHDIGDELLKLVGQRLQYALSPEDTVARYSGDEFSIILPQKGKAETTQIIEELLDVLNKPFYIGRHEIYVTTSMGISFYPQDGEDVTMLIKNANIALDQAKTNGDNNVQYYHPNMSVKSERRLELQAMLHRALERDEFVIFYQPQVGMTTEKIIGVEVLIRWLHPERGLISPAEFIPVAEETGLIIPMGEWILRTACQQILQWNTFFDTPLRLAVNLSAVQFRDKNIVNTIILILKETSYPPERLELEITESMAMDVENTLLKLEQFKNIGVQISIDDFGTGYSSLNYLKKFPIDRLKIDQSFVRDILDESDDCSIVSTIISMAHNLGLAVTAEGVETKQQVNVLRKLSCDEAQGYFFNKPLSVNEFETKYVKI
ncbi:putative bifunctional diguanylate cyclase/phosphodiesterase [Anaerobacillus sp. MEB173]|uniref:putative bifunctional diguanylate cyclase/phosphodiesterase n=1 Tax=Anaerobacillus sp. MEB173 TaxID=3383345 RepID=UPI003F924F50